MKKTMTVFLAILMTASLVAGCSAKASEPAAAETTADAPVTEAETTEAETAAASGTEETPAAGMAGMPNPMVEMTDTELAQKMGILLDAPRINEEAKCFLINGNLGEVQWHETNVNNEDVQFSLRFTADEELAPEMHGIYGTLSEKTTSEVPLTDSKTLKIGFQECGEYGIYTWKDGRMYYSLTFDKPMSQMALAEILDAVMDTTGIRYHNSSVMALPENLGYEDAIYNVAFEKDAIEKTGSSYVIKGCKLFTEELYDTVEVALLQPGDMITIEGDMAIEISSIKREREDGAVEINGGLDAGGFELLPAGGGVYRVNTFDDAASYAPAGEKDLELREDAILYDKADLENKCELKEVHGAAKVVEHLQSNDYIRPNCRAAALRLEDGKIVEISIVYVP